MAHRRRRENRDLRPAAIWEDWHMTMSDERPDGLPVGGFRIALRSGQLTEATTFYRDLVGLPLLYSFSAGGASLHDGLIFGVPDTAVTLELISADGPGPAGEHDEIVLYLPAPQARAPAAPPPTQPARKPRPPAPHPR